MTLISNPDSTLFGNIAAGEMSADELTAVAARVFGGDPRGGLTAVLKISADMVDALMGGRIAVPAPLAIALLRCCHGLPLLKQIRRASGGVIKPRAKLLRRTMPSS